MGQPNVHIYVSVWERPSMTNFFTTRVELHHASTREDYERLHTAMEAEGFSRTIKIDGITYKLPTAEYNYCRGELTKQQVLDAAKRAAATTGRTYAVLVTQANGARLWDGLEVEPPEVKPGKVRIFKKSG